MQQKTDEVIGLEPCGGITPVGESKAVSTPEAWDETAYLLGTEANAKRLLESVAQHKAGNVMTMNF